MIRLYTAYSQNMPTFVGNQVVGHSRVFRFVIQEIVWHTLAGYLH